MSGGAFRRVAALSLLLFVPGAGVAATLQDPAAGLDDWAIVLEPTPDPEVVTDASARRAIVETGWPWRLRHRASGVEMLLVPPGRYWRGAGPGDRYDRANERPRHEVRITEPFYLGRYELTNAQVRRYAPRFSSGSFYRDAALSLDGDDQPAADLSWRDAAEIAGHFGLRLPTDAEWEYAARAGVATRYPWGEDPAAPAASPRANLFGCETAERIPAMDWECFDVSDGHHASAPVGSFPANAWGFHDMTGNLWEHVADAYDENEYERYRDGAADPYLAEGRVRTLRGGGFGNAPRGSGLPYRFGMDIEDRHDGNGARLARSLDGGSPHHAPGVLDLSQCDNCGDFPAEWLHVEESSLLDLASLPPERRLDFLVGEWEILFPYRNEEEGVRYTREQPVGYELIDWFVEGTVLEAFQEWPFTGGGAIPFRAKSDFRYREEEGRWEMIWLAGRATGLFIGGLEADGSFALYEHEFTGDRRRLGTRLGMRYVFRNISRDRFLVEEYRSSDGGATFPILKWRALYRRRGSHRTEGAKAPAASGTEPRLPAALVEWPGDVHRPRWSPD